MDEERAEPTAAEVPTARHARPPRPSRTRLAWIAGGALALAAVGTFIYEQVRVSSPTSSSSAKSLAIQGIAAFKAGNYQLCEHLFTEEIAAAGSSAGAKAVGYYNLGTVMGRLHRGPASIADYQSAVRLSPRFALAWLNLGLAESARGDKSAALTAYDRLLAVSPDNVQGLFNSGVILYQEGQRATGVSRLKAAIKIDPSLVADVPAGVNLD